MYKAIKLLGGVIVAEIVPLKQGLKHNCSKRKMRFWNFGYKGKTTKTVKTILKKYSSNNAGCFYVY